MEVFVPGRLCVLGEHTDWAGRYCGDESCADMKNGICLVTVTNEGLYSVCSPIPISEEEKDSPVFIFKHDSTKESFFSSVLSAEVLEQNVSITLVTFTGILREQPV